MTWKTKVEQKLTVSYSYYWRRSDGKAINPRHEAILITQAWEKIRDGEKKGYREGQLGTSIRKGKTQWIEFTGWWTREEL